MLGRRFAVPGFRVCYERVSLDDLRTRVGSDVVAVPDDSGVLAWDARTGGWLLHAGPDADVPYRVPATLRFLEHRVRPQLPDRTFWSMFCVGDGWREDDGPPAPDAPPLSQVRGRVLCYAARRDDPEAVLIPESHYLQRFHYTWFRWEARVRRDRWASTLPSASYCGSAHGRSLVPGGPPVRELLRQVVEAEGLDVDVHLGGGVPRWKQRHHRYLLDVDGYVRTFDAWAWKLLSGRVVLSQTSPWETFFTRQFEPWTHFVPVAEDFSDLAERLEWCRAHDDECHEIARRAAARAQRVYSIDAVTTRTVEALREHLVG